MEEQILGSLGLGVSVDIQRSDGRVHSATVSAVNPNAKTVTVEWFERGETKGKEIELEAIFSLNPDLAPQDKNDMPPPQPRYNVPKKQVSSISKEVVDEVMLLRRWIVSKRSAKIEE